MPFRVRLCHSVSVYAIPSAATFFSSLSWRLGGGGGAPFAALLRPPPAAAASNQPVQRRSSHPSSVQASRIRPSMPSISLNPSILSLSTALHPSQIVLTPPPPGTASPAALKSPQQRAGITDKALYAIDLFLTTEPSGKLLLLSVLWVALMLLGAGAFIAAAKATNEDVPFGEAVWVSWTMLSDPGQQGAQSPTIKGLLLLTLPVPVLVGLDMEAGAVSGADTKGLLLLALLVGLAAVTFPVPPPSLFTSPALRSPPTSPPQDSIWKRVLSVVLTIKGLLLLALLVGLATDGVAKQVDDLNKGKGAVMERGHVLVVVAAGGRSVQGQGGRYGAWARAVRGLDPPHRTIPLVQQLVGADGSRAAVAPCSHQMVSPFSPLSFLPVPRTPPSLLSPHSQVGPPAPSRWHSSWWGRMAVGASQQGPPLTTPSLSHTLSPLAGWTPRTIPLVQQLVGADGSRAVVVLASGKGKEEMDSALLDAIPKSERQKAGGGQVRGKGGKRVKIGKRVNTVAPPEVVVVLAGGKGKEKMDSALLDAIPKSERQKAGGGQIVTRTGSPFHSEDLARCAADAAIVTRTGSPFHSEDLARCAADAARSIVLLSPPVSDPSQADAFAVVLFAAIAWHGVIGYENRDPSHLGAHESNQPDTSADIRTPPTCHIPPTDPTPPFSLALANRADISADIIAELSSLSNVRLLQRLHRTLLAPSPSTTATTAQAPPTGMRGRRRRLVPVAAENLSLRTLLSAAVHRGTADVTADLLDFENDEFYFKEWPELVGRTFGDALFLFDNATPCGLMKAPKHHTAPDASGSAGSTMGEVLVNPPSWTLIEPGDKLLVIAADRNSYRPGPSRLPPPPSELTAAAVPAATQKAPRGTSSSSVGRKQHVLICGWRPEAKQLVELLPSILAQGSEVTVVATHISPTDELLLGNIRRHKKLPIRISEWRLQGGEGSEVGAGSGSRDAHLTPIPTLSLPHPSSHPPPFLELGSPADREVLESLPLVTVDSVILLQSTQVNVPSQPNPNRHLTPTPSSLSPPPLHRAWQPSRQGERGSPADREVLESLPPETVDSRGSPADREVLESLPLETVDSVILLQSTQVNGGENGEDEEEDAGMVDSSQATVTALLIRSIQAARGRAQEAAIVAEVPASERDVARQVERHALDGAVCPEHLEAQVLAQITHDPEVERYALDGAVCPEHLEAQVLAQITHDPDVGTVLDEIIWLEWNAFIKPPSPPTSSPARTQTPPTPRSLCIPYLSTHPSSPFPSSPSPPLFLVVSTTARYVGTVLDEIIGSERNRMAVRRADEFIGEHEAGIFNLWEMQVPSEVPPFLPFINPTPPRPTHPPPLPPPPGAGAHE
ncbi:unnamed protein product [Closterium sp. NIES-64]|nr:unnamed protein product [Closterium sp. NIES-64]